MARYPAGHKEQTRERIVRTAAMRLRSHGLDGTGVASLMSDAGLTNGAFYSHFGSKDDLVGEVVADQVRAQAARFEAAAEHADGLERVLTEYLSLRHRDDLTGGCVSAALLSDLVRSSPEVRTRYAEALQQMTAAFRRVADLPDAVPDAVVLSRLAILVGTLQLARAQDDPDLAAALLDEGRRAIRRLITQDRSRGEDENA